VSKLNAHVCSEYCCIASQLRLTCRLELDEVEVDLIDDTCIPTTEALAMDGKAMGQAAEATPLADSARTDVTCAEADTIPANSGTVAWHEVYSVEDGEAVNAQDTPHEVPGDPTHTTVGVGQGQDTIAARPRIVVPFTDLGELD
jgi:hypothetical protein